MLDLMRQSGDMETFFLVLWCVTFVGLFTFIAVLRWGTAFPRFGRWLDKKLGSDWFSRPR